MKKWYSLLMAGLILTVPKMAAAMDSQTLLSDPARYRVVYADDDEVVYADMDTVQYMQTRDRPNSLDNVKFTMYTEIYKPHLNGADFSSGRLVAAVLEYEAALHVNKKFNHYNLQKELTAVFDEEGKKKSYYWRGELSNVEGEDIYLNLARIPHK